MGTHRAVIAEGYSAFKARKWVRWNAGMRESFLDNLSATCNVKASAIFIGVDPVSVYALRRRDAKFAAAWSEALALGYEMLETLLVGHALSGDTSDTLNCGAETETGPIRVDLALRLLGTHRNAEGKPQRGGAPRRYADPEDTDAMLIKKLRELAARRMRAQAGAIGAHPAGEAAVAAIQSQIEPSPTILNLRLCGDAVGAHSTGTGAGAIPAEAVPAAAIRPEALAAELPQTEAIGAEESRAIGLQTVERPACES